MLRKIIGPTAILDKENMVVSIESVSGRRLHADVGHNPCEEYMVYSPAF